MVCHARAKWQRNIGSVKRSSRAACDRVLYASCQVHGVNINAQHPSRTISTLRLLVVRRAAAENFSSSGRASCNSRRDHRGPEWTGAPVLAEGLGKDAGWGHADQLGSCRSLGVPSYSGDLHLLQRHEGRRSQPGLARLPFKFGAPGLARIRVSRSDPGWGSAASESARCDPGRMT